MTIYTTKNMAGQLAATQPNVIELDVIQPDDEALQVETSLVSEETSLSHFCEFVDYYTLQSGDPLYTAAACEQQAKTIRLTPHDVNQENMRMLIDTLLLAIDHLEKKWLDEQIQREESEQRHRRDFAHLHVKVLEGKQKQERNWITYLFQGARWVWHRLGRGRPVSQQEVAAW
jgi:hypothetical protein